MHYHVERTLVLNAL